MAQSTTIEWTEATWNPTTGCDRVSAGCDHCYALTLAKRLKAMGNPRYQRDGRPDTSGPGFGVTLHEDKLTEPLRWRDPKTVFVNSMSDLFHSEIPKEFIARVFVTMALTPQHTYQVLTKRPGRMRSLLRRTDFRDLVFRGVERSGDLETTVDWPIANVWLGVSVEDQVHARKRVPLLIDTPAAVRFLSCEPLLGALDLSAWLPIEWNPQRRAWPPTRSQGSAPIDWAIVGGESGIGYRPMQISWVRSIRDQCTSAGVAFFLKQWGGRTPKAGGRELDGRTWDELPTPCGSLAI